MPPEEPWDEVEAWGHGVPNTFLLEEIRMNRAAVERLAHSFTEKIADVHVKISTVETKVDVELGRRPTRTELFSLLTILMSIAGAVVVFAS